MGPIVAAIPAIAGVLGRLFGGGAKGAAQERTTQNAFTQNNNQLLLQRLLGSDRALMDRYSTRQGAESDALRSQSQERTGRYGVEQAARQRALEGQSREGLDRAQLGIDAATSRARQSILGSMMQNLQPVTVEGGNPLVMANMPKISGGLTPAALDPLTRQHGGELMKAALQAQLTGSDVPAATNFAGGVMDQPEATDFRSAILQTPDMPNFDDGFGGYQRAGRGESWLSGLGIGLGALGALAGTGGFDAGLDDEDDPTGYIADAVRNPRIRNPYA